MILYKNLISKALLLKSFINQSSRYFFNILESLLIRKYVYLDGNAIEEIRQDVTALKTNIAYIQQELQDLNERVARMLTMYIHIYFILLYNIIFEYEN